MKFLFALFATSVATAAAQDPLTPAVDATDLASRWDMADEPTITYIKDSNTFTIDYVGASNSPPQLQEEFYDVNCKDDGSGFPENVMRQYFTAPGDSTEKPKMAINGATLRPELKFKINTEAMAKDPLIYEVVGAATDSCLGQYYTLTANITVQVDADNFESTQLPFAFTITDRKTGEDLSIPVDSYNEVQNDLPEYVSITQKIENLCRDTDYDFTFFSADADDTTNLPTVELTYDSSGTPDVLFTKTVDEMDYFNVDEPVEGLGYRRFVELFSLPENPQNPATNLEGQDGKGMMKFCVRGGIGYADDSANDDDILDDHESTLAQAIAAGYVEVNFIESLITIFYDLTAGFTVDSFNVEPKERVETTAAKEAYDLEAWLCVSGSDMETESYGRTAPVAISDTFLAGATSPEYFFQGSLITVCVAPVEAAFSDGIRMDGITEFNWIRNDSVTATDPVTQSAIADGAAAGNLLTSYIVDDCVGGKDYCRFSSILFADFYITTGVVGGNGNAKLIFGTRRLGESSSRQLQADEGGASPFDVQVPVDITDTGPAGLKTAAGVSFAASTFTMAVALIGAALLA